MNKEGCPEYKFTTTAGVNHQHLTFAILIEKRLYFVISECYILKKYRDFWVQGAGEAASLATVPQPLCGSLTLLV